MSITISGTGAITGATTSYSFDKSVSVGGTVTYEDVSNVDSIGVITARGGIKVGAGQSVSAVSGIITYYGDGSQLTGVTAGGEDDFVATGTIPNGSTVIIKDDGTVGVVTQTGSATPSYGSEVVFEPDQVSGDLPIAYDSTNGKIVIAYEDFGNSEYATAVVGTVSGNSITFGNPVVFESGDSQIGGIIYDSSSGKVVIAYKDTGNSNSGTAIVGTVSGDSISFGTPTVFDAGATQADQYGMAYDSTNQKVVIAYKDSLNGADGTAIVGTVSGTNISFGTKAVFDVSTSNDCNLTYDSTNQKVVITYRAFNGDGKAVVATVTGTSISFGTAVVFNSGNTFFISATFDSTNGKVVIVYEDTSNSEYGTAIVGTVSGTSISFGSEVVFHSTQTSSTRVTYDSYNEKIIVAYRNQGNADFGTAVVGTVSGTSISFGTPVVFKSDYASIQGIAFDSANGKSVISYIDVNNSNYGTAIVFSATSFVTNVTAENYIGIAAESISDGQTGKVNIIGGVNSGQTGLTTARTYYVQQDGTLGLSADVPSVVAGTSISSTKIIVKG